MKKIISALLIVMLIAVQLFPMLNVSAEETLVITTYGENEDGIRSDLVTNTAILTASGFDSEDEFSAYKIIDVFYSKETNEMIYDFTKEFRAFLNQSTNDDYKNMTIEDYFNLTSDQINVNCSNCVSVITTSTLNVLASQYATYVRKNSVAGINMTTGYNSLMISGNYFATAEVEAGAYLILPTVITQVEDFNDASFGFSKNLYGVMVGNVVFTTNDTTLQWQLNDVEVFAKYSSKGLATSLAGFGLSDYFGVMDGSIDMESVDINFYQDISSSIDKKAAYVVEIDTIKFPSNAINKIYQIQITLPDGITFDNTKIYNMNGFFPTIISNNEILDPDNGNLLGNISINGQVINIEMNLENLELADWGSITISFDVWLNNYATVGKDGNEIKAIMTATDDPYVEGSVSEIEITNTIYTYGLELTNLSRDDSTLLKGAKYEVYSKYEDSILSNKIGEFTVDDDGKATLAGVPSGTIYLKQVKAPTGYQLIKDVISVEIATDDATAGTQEGYYQVIVRNDAMWYLPSTGGIGTILYTLIGLIVIGCSSFIIVYYRKRKVTNM